MTTTSDSAATATSLGFPMMPAVRAVCGIAIATSTVSAAPAADVTLPSPMEEDRHLTYTFSGWAGSEHVTGAAVALLQRSENDSALKQAQALHRELEVLSARRQVTDDEARMHERRALALALVEAQREVIIEARAHFRDMMDLEPGGGHLALDSAQELIERMKAAHKT